MSRFVCLLLLVALAGCGAQTPPSNSRAKTLEDQPSRLYVAPSDDEIERLRDESLETLIESLADATSRDAAVRALVARGADAVPTLMKALEHADPQVRAASAFALSQIGEDAAAATSTLRQMAEQDEYEVARDAAAFALTALETASSPSSR